MKPVRFWVAKSISRFFRRSPSGKQPGECRKALTAAEKYQYHLKSNACWPASNGRGRLRLAQLLTRFKSSMEVSTIPGEKSCKWVKAGQIEAKVFCEWLSTLFDDVFALNGGAGVGAGGGGLV